MAVDKDDELLQEYMAECREHLATIETDLLEIERAGSGADEQLVNRVFRAAHSIKGGAGFFNLVRIRELAHKIENALDLMRSRQMVPTPAVVSCLLLAFDKLRDLLNNYKESEGADIDEYLEALTRLASDHLPAEEKSTVTGKVSLAAMGDGRLIRVSEFDLSQARRGGRTIYWIQFDLIHDIQRRGKTPLAAIRSLMDYGVIIEQVFDVDSAGTLDDEPSNQLFFEVLYSTPLEPDLIGQVVSVADERISVLNKDGSCQPLSEARAAAVASHAMPSAAPGPVSLPAPSAPSAPAPAPAPPPVAAESGPKAPAPTPAAAMAAETTIRLNVGLLDSLMTLAGELVLSRNQLNESLAKADERGVRTGAQRVSLVTSELQEVVAATRMQPVGNLFAKFPRVVRDLARELGKSARLDLEGGDVELDKTILEELGDPLTHMVRNAVDHGIESPQARIAAGKDAVGVIHLRARHQAGQVLIEISDDGKGINAEKVAAAAIGKGLVTRQQIQEMTDQDKLALIFLPGLSTAEKVTGVSGRGVGMDVVKTNLDKLGGKIEIQSVPGKGSAFFIKLPLTLAIIPSLLVSNTGERFAIPQVNVCEMIRIPASQMAGRIDRVGGAEVLMLRDRLVPLLHLSDALGTKRPDYVGGTINVVLVDAGAFRYGLIVEQLHDTAEIVVKPLGRHLQGLRDYAGATILGDGRVSVILDVSGLAARAGLTARSAELGGKGVDDESQADQATDSLLLFHNGPDEPCAVPIELVSRIERVRHEQIEFLGGRRTVQYNGASLPLVALRDTASVGDLSEEQQWVVIIFERSSRTLGLLAAEPLDILQADLHMDSATLRQSGVAGSAVLRGKTTLILDIAELAHVIFPDCPAPVSPSQYAETGYASGGAAATEGPTVLLAEDSDFFRGQLKRMMEAIGCKVLAAEDGQAAWETLNQYTGEVDLVTTDIEMPRMDGLSLARQIRRDSRFAQLPIIALSSLAGDDDVARGLEAGVNQYQIKLNEEELLDGIRRVVRESGAKPALEAWLQGQ
jgi:two-component system, chemotaxis family, sensor kinase CheA